MQTVLILTTGGTIDKTYNEFDGSIKNRESIIKQLLLPKLRLRHLALEFHQIMSKDSSEMNESDRQKIVDFLKNIFTEKFPIIILHGTDTMELSLRHCFEHIKDPPVPVIFTGAMQPAVLETSDALQNFTEALYAAQLAEPGFYISFHGQLFPAPHVRKNFEKGIFEKTT